MLKISDILKKAKKNKQIKVPQTQLNEPSAFDMPLPPLPMPEIKLAIKPEESESNSSETAIEPQSQIAADKEKYHTIYKSDVNVIDVESAQAIAAYAKAMAFVQGVMNPLDNGQKGSFTAAEDVVEQFIALLSAEANQLLRLFFAEYSFEKGYIYQNSVNVCILCLKLAMALNYDPMRLKQIGLAALVHDIGIINYDNLISRPARFSDNDYLEVKKHPIIGKEILKKIAHDLNFEIFDVIHQEHERIDGSGYPYGLKDKEICEYARLIGVADVYEAMTHSRPYRKKLGHLKVIKELLQDKAKFENKFLKTLIDEVGIFPLMSVVKLNTKEIAEIIGQNQKMPLRPVIKVTHDAHGQKLLQAKPIDLSKNFSVYILDVYNDLNLK
ncbi:MAG: HD domain-containing protein [Candidatus Omnitrophica bacterium]|nr:HD domain-containing protein [Candidatus Omnitrophota bacterium]